VLYFPHGKETTLNEIGEMLAHVVKHMATKDDVADLRRELKGDILTVQTQMNAIELQLRETRTEVRIGALEEKGLRRSPPLVSLPKPNRPGCDTQLLL